MRIWEKGQARSRFPTWSRVHRRPESPVPIGSGGTSPPGDAVPLHPEAVAFAGHHDFDIDVKRSPRTGWRVYSYDALGSSMAIPLAQATVSPLSAAIGVHTTLLGAAVVVLGAPSPCSRSDVRALRIRTASPAAGLVSAPVSAAA
jgi:hypothetical protein